jgi:hypothetical protein
MATLFDEINRLTRKKWKDAQELAEELVSIFKETMPITTNAPFTVKQRGGKNGAPTEPAFSVQSESGDAALKITNQDGSSGTLRATQKDGLTFTPNQKGTPAFPAATAQTSSGGGGIPGKVLSGSGSTYSVALYENGPASASTKTVTVTQLQIATGETIPAGTWAIVAKTKTVYSMQAAVWL